MAADPLTGLAPMALADANAPRAPVDPGDEKAAREFEAYLVGFLATQMRTTVKGGPFSEGAASMFADLFDQEIGKRVAEGGGFGLRESISRSLGGVSGGVGGVEAAQPASSPVTRLIHGVRYDSRPSTPAVHEHIEAEDAPRAVAALAKGVVHRLTSGFGVRANPLGAGAETHPGVDLGAAAGTPIKAVRDGVVRFSGARGGYGNVVILDHGDGTETRYAHCARLDVAEGAVVKAGAPIATVGSTGRSTGPHLHFEVRRNGAAIDPSSWLATGRGPLDP